MFMQWLKRLFGRNKAPVSVTTRQSPTPAVPVDGTASSKENQPAPSAKAVELLDELVLDIRPVDDMFRIASESIEIARKTQDVETFVSRLQIASDRLAMVERHGQKHGEQVEGLEQTKESLNALMARGPRLAKSAPGRKSGARRKPTVKAVKTESLGAVRPTGRPDVPQEFAMSPWLSSSRTDDSGLRTEKFWSDIRDEAQSGRFWADEAKRARANPHERLRIALKVLPLPAAFREAATAARAMIRAAKSEKHPVDRQLELLYWLAAIDSFHVPYAERSRQPGLNVMEVGSGAEIVGLPFTYDSLGYARLDLLTATDKRVLAATWGEPKAHSTLNELHNDLWERYEDLAVQAHDRRLNRLLDQI